MQLAEPIEVQYDIEEEGTPVEVVFLLFRSVMVGKALQHAKLALGEALESGLHDFKASASYVKDHCVVELLVGRGKVGGKVILRLHVGGRTRVNTLGQPPHLQIERWTYYYHCSKMCRSLLHYVFFGLHWVRKCHGIGIGIIQNHVFY